MKKLLTNANYVFTITVLWVVLSCLLSFCCKDWSWFGRSGSILTIGGAILAIRQILRLGPEEVSRTQSIIDGGHYTPIAEEAASARQSQLDANASYLGFWFIALGTVIWGYGDLITYVVPYIADIFAEIRNAS